MMQADTVVADDLLARFPLRCASWRRAITEACTADHHLSTTIQGLVRFLDSRGTRILPAAEQVFAALELTPPEAVTVVILGQDPYPTPGDAHGLAFSVTRRDDLPRSLRNICAEVERDTGARPQGGDLTRWARQGVLLLNAVLTLDHEPDPHLAQSHQGRGWEALTQVLLRRVLMRHRPCVVMCWGKKAAATLAALDVHAAQVHRLFATHPSPLSFRRAVPGFPAFQGCSHFSAANTYLRAHGLPAIDWA